MEVEKQDIDELVAEIERAVGDSGTSGFMCVNFKDYESHKDEIENRLKELKIFDNVKIEYRYTGVKVDIIKKG